MVKGNTVEKGNTCCVASRLCLSALSVLCLYKYKYTCHPLAAAAQQRGSIAAAAAVASVTGFVPMSSVPIISAMGVAITAEDQILGELGKTLFDESRGMARGAEIRLVGPPIRVSARTNVTIGAASPQGVISEMAAMGAGIMGPVKPRKTIGLRSRVHEARSGKRSARPRTAIRAPVAGPLRARFS